MKIARNDIVEVIAGDDRGKQGRVLHVDHKKNRVTVEKVRLQKRHKKQVNQRAQGGILEAEGAIDISNVKLVSKGSRGGDKS